MANINVGIGADLSQLEAGLSQALNEVTKWYGSASKKTILNIGTLIDTDSFNKEAKQFEDNIKKLRTKLGKDGFNFSGLSSTKGGKLTNETLSFNKSELKNMNYDVAIAKLRELKALYRDLNSGKVISGADDTKKEAKRLEQLIGLLTQATTGYRNMMSAARSYGNSGTNNALEKQSGIFQRLIGFASRYVDVFSLFNFGRKIVEITGYFEQQRVAFEGVVGSAAKAQELLNSIKSFAVESPFQTKELIGYTKQLAAFSVPTDQLFETTKKLADISAGLGVDMSRIILAYGQVKAASVLRGQELRQFTEAGIPMVDALAKKFSALRGEMVSTAEVFELISNRQVSFDMVSSVLSDMTAEGGKFYKMQENITDTLYGQVQKLKDMLDIALADIGGSFNKLLTNIVKIAQAIIENFNGIAMAITIAFAGNKLRNMISSFISLNRVMSLSKKLGYSWGQKLSVAATSAGRAIKGIFKANIFGIAITAISALVGWISQARWEAGELNRKFKEIDDSFSKENAKMLGGLDSLVQKLQSAQYGTKAYSDVLSTLAQNYGDFISQDVIDALNATTDSARMTGDEFARLAENVKNAITSYNDYQAAVQKEQAARDLLKGESESASKQFGSIIGENYISRYGVSSMQEDLTSYLGRDTDTNDLRNELIKIQEEVISEWVENGIPTADAFYEIFDKKLDKRFPNIKNTPFGDVDSNRLRTRAWRSVSKDSIGYGNDSASFLQAWLDQQARVKNTDYYRANEYFVEEDKKPIIVKIDNGDGTSRDLNSFEQKDERERGYFNALLNTLKNNPDLISNSKASEEQQQKTKDAYDALVAGIEQQNGIMDSHSVNTILGLFLEFQKTFSTDSDAHKWLDEVNKAFKERVSEKSGNAARVSTELEKEFYAKWSTNPNAEKWVKDFDPTNANYNEQREKVKSEYDRVQKELDSYRVKRSEGGASKEDAEEIKRLEAYSKFLEDISKSRFFNIKLEDPKKARSKQEQVPVELKEFVESMKNAYKTYKTAVSEGGVSMGVNFMKDNKLFDQFFNGIEGLDTDVKINGKPMKEVLEGAFLSTADENGVLDFKKGFEAVQAELVAFAGDKEMYKPFANLAKDIGKYVESVFGKDDVQKWAKSLDEAFADLANTFSQNTKQVELYRNLLKNGTAGILGSNVSAENRAKAYTPDSILQLDNIKAFQAMYNKLATEESYKRDDAGNIVKDENGNPIVKQAPVLMQYDFDSLDSLDKIQGLINELNNQKELNQGAFSNTETGKQGDKLINLLNNYLSTIASELQSISGEQYTGNSLNDATANASMQANSARVAYDRQNAITIGATGKVDGAALKAYLSGLDENANTLFEKFIASLDLRSLADNGKILEGIDLTTIREKFQAVADKLPDDLKRAFETKLADFEDKVKAFNVDIGSFKAISQYIQDYKNADEKAKKYYDEQVAVEKNADIALDENKRQQEDNKRAQEDLQKQLLDAEEGSLLRDSIERLIDALRKEQEQLKAQQGQLEADKAHAVSEQERVGANGVKEAREVKDASLEGLKAETDKFADELSKMQERVNTLVNAFKSLTETVSYFYDIFSDGENPDWLKDTEAFMGDFVEGFNQAIKPILAVAAAIGVLIIIIDLLSTSLSPLAIAALVIIALAAAVALVAAAFQQYDRSLEHNIEDRKEQIEELDRQITGLQNAMTNLDNAAQRMVGLERFGTQLESIGKNAEVAAKETQKAALAAQNAADEEAKKNTDEDALQEYKDEAEAASQAAQEATDEFLNGLLEMRDELVGSVDDWAGAMSDAIRGAFQNGENAARAFRSTIKEMMGDVVQQMLELYVLQPAIEGAMNNLFGGTVDEIASKYTNKDGTFNNEGYLDYIMSILNDPKKMEEFYSTAENAGDAAIDWLETAPEIFKEWFSHNAGTSALSGGIESITEDTARRLEAIFNGTFSEVIAIRLLLENYFAMGGGYGDTAMTTIQSAVTLIQSDVSAISVATRALEKHITELRDTSNRPLHVVVA